MSPKWLTGIVFLAACGQVMVVSPPEARAATTYSATLKWTIPATRTDGAPLLVGELAGYQIYYTTENPAISGIFSISGGTSSSYVASQLAAGNYYFTISAIDIFGRKSAMSNLVSIKLGP